MVKNYNFRNQQKIKDEQINYLLGDLEKNLEDYKDAIEIKEKQLAEARRILVAAKQSFDKVSQENRDLKAYIENLKQRFQQQQANFLNQQKAFYSKQNKAPKNIKKQHSKKKTKVKTNLNQKKKNNPKTKKFLKNHK